MIERIFRQYPMFRVFYKGLARSYSHLFNREGRVRVMEEEWDHLIVLDACRYDYFRDINWIRGKLESRISLGSHTEEWAEKNFPDEYPDVFYISGNPYLSEVKCKEKFGKNPFFGIEDVWDYGWDDDSGFLHPQEISRAALQIKEKYSDKRLIIHYLQPHWPFPPDSVLSKKNFESMKLKKIEKGFMWNLTEKLAGVFPELSLALEKREREKGNVWDYLRDGLVSVEEAKKAYRENIKLVLREVESLIAKLPGKIVVTSDHGNLFGEHWIFGHPPGFNFKELLEVPWLIVEGV